MQSPADVAVGKAVLFSGPHSYAAAPVEVGTKQHLCYYFSDLFVFIKSQLFFAAFKREDINPRKLKCGKKVRMQ